MDEIAKALQRWLAENKIKTIYIEPEKPRSKTALRCSLSIPGRVPEPRAALDPDRGPRTDRRLQEQIDNRVPPAQQAWLPKPGLLRGQSTSIPGSGQARQAGPSLRQGWTTSVNPINIS